MKLAIDIGSNTMKCLLGKVENGRVVKIFEQTVDSRICADGARLVPNAAKLVSDAVLLFKKNAEPFGSFRTVVVATSALRDAENRDAVVAEVLRLTGEKITVLSGGEEARLSYAGAVSGLDAPRECFYFDLGGGSLELVYGDGCDALKFTSIPIGAVRLTREFFPNGEISFESLEALRAKVRRCVSDALCGFPKTDCVVCAGGAVVAARMLKKRLGLAGREDVISLSDMLKMAELLRGVSAAERTEKFGIPPLRADIVCAAFETVAVLMRCIGAAEITHTFFNLRYGVVLSNL